MGQKRYFWAIFGPFSYFLANFFLFSGGGQNQYFSYFFFPISGRRPENPVLAGGQGRNLKSIFSGPNQVEIGSKSGPNQVRRGGRDVPMVNVCNDLHQRIFAAGSSCLGECMH